MHCCSAKIVLIRFFISFSQYSPIDTYMMLYCSSVYVINEMVKEAKNVFKTGAATSVLSYWSQQVDLWHHRAP